MGTIDFYGTIHITYRQTSKGRNCERKCNRSLWMGPTDKYMVNLRLLVSACDVFFHAYKYPFPCDVMMSCWHSLQFCDVFFHDVKLAIHMINSSISERSPRRLHRCLYRHQWHPCSPHKRLLKVFFCSLFFLFRHLHESSPSIPASIPKCC